MDVADVAVFPVTAVSVVFATALEAVFVTVFEGGSVAVAIAIAIAISFSVVVVDGGGVVSMFEQRRHSSYHELVTSLFQHILAHVWHEVSENQLCLMVMRT